MPTIDLDDVKKELRANGFAQRAGTLKSVQIAALLSRGAWASAPQKDGEAVSLLRPMEATEAPRRTLSAVHGLDAQPLHTDGAHLRRMPDVIVLHATQPTVTPTAVWKAPSSIPSSLYNGVFTVRGNGESFLAHAYADQRLRFDPVCMSPADHLAKEAAAFLESARADAQRHHWEDGSTLLFIDNRKALHARDAVVSAAEAKSRVIERAAYSLEER